MAGLNDTPGLSLPVDLTGLSTDLLALEAVDPNMVKAFRKHLGSVGGFVAKTAAAHAPVGKSRKGHEAGAMKRGYTSRVRNSRRDPGMTLVQVRNTTAEGSILELAGRGSRGKTPQGQSLIKTLDARYGAPGRFMWDAYDFLQPEIHAEFAAAASEVEAELQRAFGKVK